MALDWPRDPDEPDEFDDDRDDDLDDDLEVEFAFDIDGSRLACVYTRGLWWLGIPELYVSPPQSFGVQTELDWARLTVLLASGLIHLGQELMAVDGFDLPPYRSDFDGTPLILWIERQEAPEGKLAIALTSEVDTVLRVGCSLWQPPPHGQS
jgi:hypothetical protein